jgi:hypothetical protein
MTPIPLEPNDEQADDRARVHLRLPKLLAAKLAAHCVLAGTDKNTFITELLQRELGGMAIARRGVKASENLRIA